MKQKNLEKLAEIQKLIDEIEENNSHADITMKFQDGEMIFYYLTKKIKC